MLNIQNELIDTSINSNSEECNIYCLLKLLKNNKYKSECKHCKFNKNETWTVIIKKVTIQKVIMKWK